jgi:hypothetical protein
MCKAPPSAPIPGWVVPGSEYRSCLIRYGKSNRAACSFDLTPLKTSPMSSLDLDLDAHMNNLELEWRQAYETSIVARADYQSLAASPKANADLLDMARERLDRTEALKARIMAKIERLEGTMLGQD